MKNKQLYPLLGALLFTFLGPESVTAQGGPPQQAVSGTVTDALGLVTGVNVILLGKNNGTFSDREGQYRIMASPADTLVFTYLGYKTVELPVGNRTQIDVRLQEEATALQEVEVNAGYYTVKERERTGSISRVTAKEIEMQPVISPLEALQGRMAGVEIVQRNGVPGTAASIQIRGQNSLRISPQNNGNLPLYIIDGIPVSSAPISTNGPLQFPQGIDPLNTLNLANIESIEVLKDADATAIYGSRGANGVILITTKNRSAGDGQTSLDIQLYSGVGKVSNTMKLLNTEQYLYMRREAFANDGVSPTENNARDLLLWDQNRYADWQKELFGRTTFITDMQTSVSGGNQYTSILFGGSYHKEGTVFPGNFYYQKGTGNLSLNHRSKDKKFQTTLSLSYGVDRQHLFNGSFVEDAISLPPNAPKLYNENGGLNWENSTWTNPLSILDQPQDISTNNLIVNSLLSYKVLSNIDFKVSMGYTKFDLEEVIKTPKSSFDPAFQDAILNRSQHLTTTRSSWIIEPQLVYAYRKGSTTLDGIVGATFQKNINNIFSQSGAGYVDESLIGNLGAADITSVSRQEDIIYAYTALFGRIGLNWDEKYFVNLTGRRDGSSRFGPNKRFTNFGAVGVAWIFSEEPFIKNTIPILSFGKLRGSYGTTGNDQIPDYGYYDSYEPTSGPKGLYPIQLTNPDYSWELNKKLEAALELELLDNRIQLSTSWYRNRSSNQLVGYPLPTITGFSSVQANFPATVQNTGWELELTTRNIRSRNLTWETYANISFPKNELVDFPKIEQTSYSNTYRVGEPLNLAILYQFNGIDPETGMYEVRDVNEDGRYDYDDRIILKNLGRRYYGGFGNNLIYNGFQLNFLFEFVKQTGISNQFIHSYPPGFGPPFGGNVSTHGLNDRGQLNDVRNTQKHTQSFGNYSGYIRARNSDLAYNDDASFMRLKTLSLAYQLPQKLISGTGLKRCKIYLHAQNLFTITDYIGLDPQFPGGTSNLPTMRTYTGGIQLRF